MQHIPRTLRIPLATLVVLSSVTPAASQPSYRVPVEQVALQRKTDTKGRPESVTFARRAAEVGDQVEQHIAIEMRLTTAHRQGASIIEKRQMAVRNEQRRTVTTDEVRDGRATAVLVRYQTAVKQLDQWAADEPPSDASPPPPQSQPVEGNAYRCRREPGDDGKLIVTDEAGHIPPVDQYELVARHMEAVGRPNPLVEFLAGRTIGVGQTVALPDDVAERLFGMGEQFGEVARFDLTLTGTDIIDGAACAVFHADVEAASTGSSQMRLQVDGPLVVQVDACRAVTMRLAGPIAMSESRGSHSNAYYLISTGRLETSIESNYRDVAR